LPGVTGRFDHFAVDLKGQRLFVAALGNDTVEVIDIAGGKRGRTVKGLRKPQGVAYLTERNQLVVASGGDGTVKFFNGTTYAAGQTLLSLDDADNVRVDGANNTIYAGYGDGALAVIDSATGKLSASIKLAGHPESFQLDQHGSRIFVNVPDAKHVAVVDRKSRNVVATWPLTELQANYPMSLDEPNHRLFVGCRRPARLVVLDTESGRRVADIAISGDTDDLFYDAARKRIYVACGAGSIDVITQRDADHYELREHVATSSGARTAYFAPDLQTLFLAVPQRGTSAAEIRSYKVE
jgi:YVTN family beta-propeller protein